MKEVLVLLSGQRGYTLRKSLHQLKSPHTAQLEILQIRFTKCNLQNCRLYSRTIGTQDRQPKLNFT